MCGPFADTDIPTLPTPLSSAREWAGSTVQAAAHAHTATCTALYTATTTVCPQTLQRGGRMSFGAAAPAATSGSIEVMRRLYTTPTGALTLATACTRPALSLLGSQPRARLNRHVSQERTYTASRTPCRPSPRSQLTQQGSLLRIRWLATRHRTASPR